MPRSPGEQSAWKPVYDPEYADEPRNPKTTWSLADQARDPGRMVAEIVVVTNSGFGYCSCQVG
jgi:hypothetical protein